MNDIETLRKYVRKMPLHDAIRCNSALDRVDDVLMKLASFLWQEWSGCGEDAEAIQYIRKAEAITGRKVQESLF